jgi:hypothetical protein
MIVALRRSVGHYVVGVLLNAIVFAAIGPAVAATLVCLGFSLLANLQNPLGALAMAPLLLWLGLPLGYWMGASAAAVTGCLVAIATSLNRRPVAVYGCAAVIGAICSATLIVHLPSGADQFPPVLLGLVGALASLACTRIARPFRLTRLGDSDHAGEHSGAPGDKAA